MIHKHLTQPLAATVAKGDVLPNASVKVHLHEDGESLYLLSEAGSWITGKVLEVDGGTVDSNWPFSMPSGLSGPRGG